MNSMKFSNELANHKKNGANPSKIFKRVTCIIEEDATYHPIMIELFHLLERTHTILNEDEIINRIKELESANSESVSTHGIFWQTRNESPFMLFDERALSFYKEVFEDYLDPALILNLKNYLEETNKKRLADYLVAGETEKKNFSKIIVVNLGASS